MYYYLIYFSKAAGTLSDESLIHLLNQSKTWNQAHGLTGMLIYIQGSTTDEKGGRFMQVLEGNKGEVTELFAKIKVDKRHSRVTLLNEGVIKTRNFDTWSMGFKSLKHSEYRNMPEYFELDERFLKSGSNKKFNASLNFLKSFYMINPTL